MIYRLLLRPIVTAEIREVAQWYHGIDPELGRALTSELDLLLARICDRPLAYPILRSRIRKAPVKRFPYNVFYEIVDDAILVLALMHTSRYPRFGHH